MPEEGIPVPVIKTRGLGRGRRLAPLGNDLRASISRKADTSNVNLRSVSKNIETKEGKISFKLCGDNVKDSGYGRWGTILSADSDGGFLFKFEDDDNEEKFSTMMKKPKNQVLIQPRTEEYFMRYKLYFEHFGQTEFLAALFVNDWSCLYRVNILNALKDNRVRFNFFLSYCYC